MRKYIVDEHGQISPEDLDKWHDEDEYDKILKAVLAVPKKVEQPPLVPPDQCTEQ